MTGNQRAVPRTLTIAGALLGVVAIVVACLVFREAGVIASVFALALAVAIWATRRPNPWKGWAPPPGVTIEDKPTEIPVLSDHRAIIGGEPKHLIEGDGWYAFDVLGRNPGWVVAIPLGRDAGRWHAEPLNLTTQPVSLDVADRYLAVGVPVAVKSILAAHDVEADIRCVGDVLLARYPAMGPAGFTRWLADDLPVLLGIRDVVAPVVPVDEPSALPSAIGYSAAHRNVWQGSDAAAPTEFPLLPGMPESEREGRR